MARPRTHDHDQALEAAMQVFWTKGFERASLSDLEAATGMSRASLYAAFGDKRALFHKALKLYGERLDAGRIGALREAADPRAALRAHFEGLARTTMGAVGPGCLLTNTAIELTGREPETARGLTRGIGVIEEVFAELVARGQAMGQFTTERPARQLARHLVGLAQSLRVLSRNPDLAPWMDDILDTGLSVLDPPQESP
ncbi:MAG: helix-turn-helix domain-containing protein [Pseudomonadota bacterium]